MEEEDKEHCEGSSGGDKEIKLHWSLFSDNMRIFCLILCTVLRFRNIFIYVLMPVPQTSSQYPPVLLSY